MPQPVRRIQVVQLFIIIIIEMQVVAVLNPYFTVSRFVRPRFGK